MLKSVLTSAVAANTNVVSAWHGEGLPRDSGIATGGWNPGPTQTITRNGQTWQFLTGPSWTNCPYDGRTRPCRPIKE